MGDRGRRGSFARRRTARSVAFAAIFSAAMGMVIGGRVGAETTETPEEADESPPHSQDSEVLSVPGHATPTKTRDPGAARGEPGLDDLLKLPSDYMTKGTAAPPVAGASEDEWKQRFTRAEKAIGEARESIAETRRELDGLAETGGASQWSVAPPGAAGGGQGQAGGASPLSFKLRQELVRNREALDTAEKALRELRIEADLAGVPAEWRVVAASPTPAPAQN
jgi:hypothetical protein